MDYDGAVVPTQTIAITWFDIGFTKVITLVPIYITGIVMTLFGVLGCRHHERGRDPHFRDIVTRVITFFVLEVDCACWVEVVIRDISQTGCFCCRPLRWVSM